MPTPHLPDWSCIIGKPYRTVRDPKLGERSDAVELCVTGTLQIFVDASKPPAVQEEAWLHGVFEAVKHELGLKLPHKVLLALCSGVYGALKSSGGVTFGACPTGCCQQEEGKA